MTLYTVLNPEKKLSKVCNEQLTVRILEITTCKRWSLCLRTPVIWTKSLKILLSQRKLGISRVRRKN